MLFGKFSNINIYVKLVGKMHHQNFNVSIFSNPGKKIPKRLKQWDKSVLYFPGSRHQVPGSRYQVPGTGTRFKVTKKQQEGFCRLYTLH